MITKSEVSSQESEWNEKLVVVYINTNCGSVLAGIAKLHLFFFSYSYMLEYWHLHLSSHTKAGSFCYVGPSNRRMGSIIVRHAAMMSALGQAVLL